MSLSLDDIVERKAVMEDMVAGKFALPVTR
jgi:hypothetical protein